MVSIMLGKEDRVINKIDICVCKFYIWWEEINIKINYVIINVVIFIVFLCLLGCILSYYNKEILNFNGLSNIDICVFFI